MQAKMFTVLICLQRALCFLRDIKVNGFSSVQCAHHLCDKEITSLELACRFFLLAIIFLNMLLLFIQLGFPESQSQQDTQTHTYTYIQREIYLQELNHMIWGTGKCEICSASLEILPGVNIAVLSPKVILPFLGPSVFFC